MAAPVELFSTSILSNYRIRQRHERYVSILTVKRVPFVYHDLASDEEAKKRWRGVAKDASIPGLLVHNEWRGTFEEFEEAVEFGELDLFLRIDAKRAEREAKAFAAQYPEAVAAKADEDRLMAEASAKAGTAKSSVEPAPKHSPVVGLAQPRLVSHSSKIAAAPSAPLPMAPKGTGGRRELNPEAFLESLGLDDLKLSEEELREILEEGAKEEEEEKRKSSGASPSAAEATKTEVTKPLAEAELTQAGRKKYPDVLGKGMATTSASKPVPRTYTPSAEAGIKPLRLAKMGKDPLAPRSATSPLSIRANRVNESSSPPPPLPRGAANVTARYNTAQLSSKALAAEAAASVSKRALSGTALRSAVSSGETLEQALEKARAPSASDSVVGREDPDELLKSLGLMDLKLTDEEAEAFLLDGTIPEGATEGGARLGRRGSSADRAREETAAREVAKRARERGYGTPTDRRSSDSARSSVSHSRAASVSGSLADVKEGEDAEGGAAKEDEEEEKSQDQTTIPDEEDQPTIDASPAAKGSLSTAASPPTSPPLLPAKNAKRTSSGSTSGAAASGPSSPPTRPARSSTRLSSGSIPSLAALNAQAPPPAQTTTKETRENSGTSKAEEKLAGARASSQAKANDTGEVDDEALRGREALLEQDARKGEALLGVDLDQDGLVEDDGATPQMGTRALPSDSSIAEKMGGTDTPRDGGLHQTKEGSEGHAEDLAIQLAQTQAAAAATGSDTKEGLTPSGSRASGISQVSDSDSGSGSGSGSGIKPERLDLSIDGAKPGGPSSSSSILVVSASPSPNPKDSSNSSGPGPGLVASPSIELSEAEAVPVDVALGGLNSAPSNGSLAASSLSSSSSLSIPNSATSPAAVAAAAAGATSTSPPSGPIKTPSRSASSTSNSGGGRTSSTSASRSPLTPSSRRTGMDYQRREASGSSSSSFSANAAGEGGMVGRPPPLTLSPSPTSNGSSGVAVGGPTSPPTPGSAGKKSRFGSMAKAISGHNKDKERDHASEKRSTIPSFGLGGGRKKSSTSLRGTSSSGSGSGSSGVRGEERRAKTLSQILREADAAMAAEELGSGAGGGGEGEGEGEEEEEPDDGMGRLPEEEEGLEV